MKKIVFFMLFCVAFGAESSLDSANADIQNPALIKTIKSAVEARFLEHYKSYNIKINSLEITPLISQNLAKFSVEHINFDLVRKTSGNFEVQVRHNERKKRVFFNFKIDATLDAISALGSIKTGEVISTHNTAHTQIPLTRNMALPASAEILNEYEAKSFIAGGATILPSKITPKIIIRKGDVLSVAFVDSGIGIVFSVRALENGAKGQNIRAQNTQSEKEIIVTIIDEKNAKMGG